MTEEKKVVPLRPAKVDLFDAREAESSPEATFFDKRPAGYETDSGRSDPPFSEVDDAPGYVPLPHPNYADAAMLFPMMTPELIDAIERENAARQARGERKLVGRAYTDFVRDLPDKFKYGQRAGTPKEIMKGRSVDERRALQNGVAALNRERRAMGREPITLAEYVAGRRE